MRRKESVIMSGSRRPIRAAFSLLVLIAVSYQHTFLSRPSAYIPPGYRLIISDTGAELYKRDGPDGMPAFVQVVHLDQGATLSLLHGPMASPGKGQGAYGGDNPAFWRQTLQEVWDGFVESSPAAFCITNGQFYSSNRGPAQLAFPLKLDSRIISDGYGLDEYPNLKLMLEIWPERADIRRLTRDALYTSSAPDIIAGLAEHAAGNRPNKPTGRTFVGVDDKNLDGQYETIVIFNSSFARKTEAAAALRSFGANKVMMLDGGASTQLICKGNAYISADRTIPQTIVVVSPDGPVRSPTAVEALNFP